MYRLSWLLSAVLLWAAVATAQKSTKPAPPKKTAAASKKPAAKKKTTTAAVKKKTPARARTSSSRRRRPSYRAGQQKPTPERYAEIQRALVQRGYLDGSTDGKWDQRSIDALKKFQTSQNMKPDGKLDSLSLIALGLGPKRLENVQHPVLPRPVGDGPAVEAPSLEPPPAPPQ